MAVNTHKFVQRRTKKKTFGDAFIESPWDDVRLLDSARVSLSLLTRANMMPRLLSSVCVGELPSHSSTIATLSPQVEILPYPSLFLQYAVCT